MIKRLVLVLAAVLAIAGGLFAAEVGLVTDLQGSASARLEQDSWPLTLAEILPDGVEIKVSAKSSMVIVHMLNNQEYHLAEGALASISTTDISGTGVTASALQLVSSDLSLDADSANQAGSASIDRGEAAGIGRLAFSQKAFDAEGVSSENAADSFTAPEERISESLPENIAMSKKSQESLRAAKVSSPQPRAPAAPAPKSSQAPAVPIMTPGSVTDFESASVADHNDELSLVIAIPVEEYIKICATNKNLVEINGAHNYAEQMPTNGWVSIAFAPVATESETILELCGTSGTMPVKVLTKVGPIVSIVAAWKLEKAGYICQAAAMWLTIGKAERMNPEKIAVHLKRLKKQLVK